MMWHMDWEVNLQPQHVMLNVFHPKHGHHARKKGSTYAEGVKEVELEVVECGKTAFLSEISELQSELEFLSGNYYWKRFYKSRDILQVMPAGAFF